MEYIDISDLKAGQGCPCCTIPFSESELEKMYQDGLPDIEYGETMGWVVSCTHCHKTFEMVND